MKRVTIILQEDRYSFAISRSVPLRM